MRNDVPGWTTEIDELSSGVFKVTLIDRDGRKAEIIDNATDATINLAKDYAFDIERTVRKPWNKFLYDFCLISLSESAIVIKQYDNSVFGSWVIMVGNNRLVYYGKDSCIIYQTNEIDVWVDRLQIDDEEIKYTNLTDLVSKLKP